MTSKPSTLVALLTEVAQASPLLTQPSLDVMQDHGITLPLQQDGRA